jgi:hypothetical protein
MFSDIKVRLLLQRKKLKASLRRMVPTRGKLPLYDIPPVRRDTPQTGLAIVAIVKNEASYLAEWIEFHAMLGVEHFYIYDNDSSDNTAEVLAPYIKDGLVTITPWRNFSQGLHPQYAAYAHAMTNYVVDFRWAAIIDVDEFIFPVQGNSLVEVLKELGDLPAVSMPWINFGPSGHQKRPEGLVIANYTERAAFPPRNDQYSLLRYKTIVNPREVTVSSTHYFTLRGRGKVIINDRGLELPGHQGRDIRYVTSDRLRLHHYFTRSHQEIEEKIAKGRVSKAGAVKRKALERRLNQYNLAVEKDTSILRFVPELERRLAKRLASRGEPRTSDF